MFSKKTTKIDEIFNVDLTLCSKCQIDVEDFVNFLGLLRKHELCANTSYYTLLHSILRRQIKHTNNHGLRTPGEKISFTARPKINSHFQIFRYDQSTSARIFKFLWFMSSSGVRSLWLGFIMAWILVYESLFQLELFLLTKLVSLLYILIVISSAFEKSKMATTNVLIVFMILFPQ